LVLHEGIRPPKFAHKFHRIDFEAGPMPVLSLFPPPEPVALAELAIDVCDLDCRPRSVRYPDLAAVPRRCLRAPLICQIFNWACEVEWEGISVSDFLDHAGLTASDGEYLSFSSRDRSYFESMPVSLARDPRVLLATTMDGAPLPTEYGGPLRLIVPFLQGYKSVKWLGGVRVLRHDPIGIKRLLGQSKTGRLGKAWRDLYDIEVDDRSGAAPI
jgi:DMSO/TMAO reductase YedYZ molybdopterin-dependent catalytic subunit